MIAVANANAGKHAEVVGDAVEGVEDDEVKSDDAAAAIDDDKNNGANDPQEEPARQPPSSVHIRRRLKGKQSVQQVKVQKRVLKKPSRKGILEDHLHEIVAARQAGKSFRSIAIEFGATVSSIHYILKKKKQQQTKSS